jgi:hypothetical protein
MAQFPRVARDDGFWLGGSAFLRGGLKIKTRTLLTPGGCGTLERRGGAAAQRFLSYARANLRVGRYWAMAAQLGMVVKRALVFEPVTVALVQAR